MEKYNNCPKLFVCLASKPRLPSTLFANPTSSFRVYHLMWKAPINRWLCIPNFVVFYVFNLGVEYISTRFAHVELWWVPIFGPGWEVSSSDFSIACVFCPMHLFCTSMIYWCFKKSRSLDWAPVWLPSFVCSFDYPYLGRNVNLAPQLCG